ncbi:MAG TPA: glycosyltransferase family 4 protein [Acidimicrobiales bacterium]|nr:glycosyltransferase family 4 protein [Acidimicrobiales bacterium]
MPPPGYGGTERVLDDLCRELAVAGHHVLLYATGDSTCPVERRWTFETARGTELTSPAMELRHVTDAYDAVRQWGAEVVHDHTLAGPFYAERFPDLPVVTTNHGPFEGDLGALYARLAESVPVIAISHHQASTAHGTPVAGVIHHGVDVRRFPVGGGAGGYAVFLGRMCADKGVHTAIRVARAAGMPLRIAAKMREQAEHDYFTDMVKPLLGGDVEYLGEVGGAAKLDLLGGAACLLNPIAWAEPFGMVMIEAMACGTPVVGTPHGASPEIVDEALTGFLRSDEESLAAALGHVDRLDRRACRAVVERRFSAARMAADHAVLFDRVVAGRADCAA